MRDKPWILGVSASHNGATCLLQGDRIVVAVQEERLTREKRQNIFPARPFLSLRYCLDHAGITIDDVAAIAVTVQGSNRVAAHDITLNPEIQSSARDIPIVRVSHHLAHAASTFATSPFEEAAVLVIDGIGSPDEDLSPAERDAVVQGHGGWETTSLYRASLKDGIIPVRKFLTQKPIFKAEGVGMPRFRSFGGMFMAASTQIFGESMEAGKVMGLAPYGKVTIPWQDFLSLAPNSISFFDEVPSRFPFSERWPLRQKEYEDLAASTQAALEHGLLFLANELRSETKLDALCYSGGVALNSVANEEILKRSGFRDMFIFPAAEDSGTAVGAAFWALWQLTARVSSRCISRDAFGQRYSRDDIDTAILACPHIARRSLASHTAIDAAADLLAEGRIGGWFEGGSELGPRALGQRSILCDPRRPDAKDTLNQTVKHRESFRPFAPAILLDHVDEWFEPNGTSLQSPFMLRVRKFRDDKQGLVPGVVHVDGTGRLQTVTEANGPFCSLLRAFSVRTGVPVLLNTSFNVMGEPIVETPEDAIWCMLLTGLEFCVLEDTLIEKSSDYRSPLDLFPVFDAGSYTFHVPTSNRRFTLDLPETLHVTCRVETRWGKREVDLPPSVIPALLELDGSSNGWTFLSWLRSIKPESTERSAIKLLAELRRKRVIRLSQTH